MKVIDKTKCPNCHRVQMLWARTISGILVPLHPIEDSMGPYVDEDGVLRHLPVSLCVKVKGPR